MPAAAEFRLSITKALGDQLAVALDGLTPHPLSRDELDRLDSRGGVYQLYHRGDLVYIGKAERSIPDRLSNHMRKISGRENISLDEMGFTALYVDEDLAAVAPETLLINRHRQDREIPWNYNGFGNKDPGRERDTSRVNPNHFDAQYPANLEYPCSGIEAGTYQVIDLLRKVKVALPYVFRYQDGGKRPARQHPDYHETSVTISEANPSADAIFTILAEAMPAWQITALPGYVIMYRQQRDYPSARKQYGQG